MPIGPGDEGCHLRLFLTPRYRHECRLISSDRPRTGDPKGISGSAYIWSGLEDHSDAGPVFHFTHRPL